MLQIVWLRPVKVRARERGKPSCRRATTHRPVDLHARVVARDEHVGEVRSRRNSARDQAVKARSGLAWHQSRADGLDEVRRRLCGWEYRVSKT